ncbi:MAG: hypothetical protein C0494_09445 [Sphingobium sp.]|uniref:Glycosyl transferase family 2 n=2 Tax=Sphingomonadaceae TaxID=41297 RepID=A0ABM7G7S5_9SPHN|nr:glycosyltransferase family 2 protein [Sphingomonas bisphenolicum]MBA4090803.1 hypothetical protein [Sphingobium sp.]BBF71412.1 hypothetical protein SBA_ch1_36120 [Sphingomonas bisphenolicum]
MMTTEADEIRALARSARLTRVGVSRLAADRPGQPIVICIVRNELRRLPYFLAHYRRLGAAHFLFVDNGSTDGSREFLASQADVDLFEMLDPFSAKAKHGWIMRLVEEYGDRWYMLADADEHAVFHGTKNLQSLAAAAERSGLRRVRGFLLDMYSDKPLAIDHRRSDQSFLQAYPFFDPEGYRDNRLELLTSRMGGPRQRTLSRIKPDFMPEMTKYPLFRLTADETLVSPHYVDPPLLGDDPCWIALLHFKFDGDALAHISDAIARGQYWQGSYEYRVYDEAIRRFSGFSFMYPDSRRYRGTADLVDLGLIEAVPV